MKVKVFFLCCILLFTCGCSSSPPETAQADKKDAQATPATKAEANAKKGGKKSAKKGGKESKAQAQNSGKTLQDAEAAYADGRYRDAATIAQNTLDSQRADEAPRTEIIKTMDYLAQCQVKAEMYDKACLNYKELLKAKPDNQDYVKALGSTRKAYWDRVLGPKLAEAERLRDKNRLSPASSLADEVITAALKVGIDPKPADQVLASIEKAKSQSPAHASKNKKSNVARNSPPPKEKAKPKPVRVKTAPIETDSYPKRK